MRAALLATSRRRPRVSDLPAALGDPSSASRRAERDRGNSAGIKHANSGTRERRRVRAVSLDATTTIRSARRYPTSATRHARPPRDDPREHQTCPFLHRVRFCPWHSPTVRRRSVNDVLGQLGERVSDVLGPMCQRCLYSVPSANRPLECRTKKGRSQLCRYQAGALRHSGDIRRVRDSSLDATTVIMTAPDSRTSATRHARQAARPAPDSRTSATRHARPAARPAPRYSNLRNAARTSGRATRAAILEPPQRGTHVRPRDPRRDTRTSATRHARPAARRARCASGRRAWRPCGSRSTSWDPPWRRRRRSSTRW
jgi:hypothetical protein